MIIKWTSVGEVIARVTRNIKGVDADFLDDLPEWIAEAIFKMKTTYQLVLEEKTIDIRFHRANIPCKAEAIGAVVYQGRRMMVGQQLGPLKGLGEQARDEQAFFSVIQNPGSTPLLEETDVNNWPYYLMTVEALNVMQVERNNTYRLKYNVIETTVLEGQITVYYWTVPHDECGLPLVPDNEDYKTAIYWYCRMMCIGAGFEDKVFKFDDCEVRWEKHAGRAINQISYPSVDEKKRNIQSNVSLIPMQYEWETFGQGGPEGIFNDELG